MKMLKMMKIVGGDAALPEEAQGFLKVAGDFDLDQSF
jgi:hypothetical protein